ncbi:MAG: Gfo/Idh/MocA family oxidoreductase [Chloroflexi bacterium]|nr:Gfo/Idh/MocA family oxidoreductase [Chloroflexota bacterium]
MTLRIAIAGTGYIAAIHARAVLNQPDAALAAVVTTQPDGAERFRRDFSIPSAYSRVEDLVNSETVDALIICTPNALHARQAITALRAGLHVMVEKPMAVNAAEALQMHNASRETGRLLMVAHCWRFDSEVLWLKEQVQSGKLGEIVRTKGCGVHTLWGPSGWFTSRALAGGGALADMGIHAIDTARFLLDDPLPAQVYAKMGSYYLPRSQPEEDMVEDTCMMMIQWDNGATSYIESGWWQPHADGPEAATQLYGTCGFGSIFPTRLGISHLEEQKLEWVDPGFPFPRPEHSPQEMYDRQMAYFLQCIGQGQTPNPGGLEGLTNMRITDAAYESSRTGRAVNLQQT